MIREATQEDTLALAELAIKLWSGFQWPRSESEARLLTQEQYVWLMQGLSTEQPKAIQKSKKYTDII